MPQKPPAWTPSDGTIGQAPLMLSRDVDSTGVHPSSGQDASALADQMVRAQQPVINRFVAMVRQQLEISGKDVHTARLPLPGMEVYYTHVQGLERMHYHISPVAEALPPSLPELPTIEEPSIPAVPVPPVVPEPEEAKAPEPPEVPEVPEPEVPELPGEEEPEKPEPGTPDFLSFDMPVGLAVEFLDGAN